MENTPSEPADDQGMNIEKTEPVVAENFVPEEANEEKPKIDSESDTSASQLPVEKQTELCSQENIKAESLPEAPEPMQDKNIKVEQEESMDAETTAAPEEIEKEGGAKANVGSPSQSQSGASQFPVGGQPGFSSEYFKIEIRNLPRNCMHGQLKKLLLQLNLKPKKIKIMSHNRYCYVTFACEEDKLRAIRTLQSYVYRNFKLNVKHAKPLDDPYFAAKGKNKKGNKFNKDSPNNNEDESLSKEERIQNAVTPLWKMSYEEQIQSKLNNIVELMKKLTWQLTRVRFIGKWVRQQSEENGGICCKLHDVIKSPVIYGYRNKGEFNVGRAPGGNEKVVGFRVSSYKKGDCSVVPPDVCINVSQQMKDVVKSFQSFVQSSSLDPLDPVTHQGNWQQIMLRSCQSGDIMAIAQFYPQDLPQNVVDEEKKKFTDFYTTGEGSHLQIKSLYFQTNNITNVGGNASAPLDCIAGDECIYEEVLGLKFRISPSSFFQVNTQCSALLYGKIKELCQVTPQTTFLDICCGIGTIGLTMAKDCNQVIGVDWTKQAIEDAEFNARLNGITNAEYHCGKAEDILPNLVNHRLKDEAHIVGVVDPPRAGLHHSVVRAIRACQNIHTLIYVSCNPNNAYSNFVDFCRPFSNRAKGKGFRLVQAIPVDLFPHTPHCELILHFVRD